MNKRQENQFNMLYAVQDVMQQNQAKWNGVPALVTLNTELDGNIAAIEEEVQIQVSDTKGWTKAKGTAETAMINATLFVAGGVRTWAVTTGNEGLAEAMDIVESELRDYRDSVVATRCQEVHDTALANLASLADYGIVAANVTDLQTKIDAYVALIPTPRNMITEKTAATQALDLLIKDSTKLLKQRMDLMMRRFAVSEPDFHNQYTQARIVVDLSGRSAPPAAQPAEG